MRIYGVAVIVVQPDKKRFLVKKYTRRKYTVRFFQWKEAWFLKKYFVYFKNLLRPVASNCKFRWISVSTRVCISRHGQHHFICFFFFCRCHYHTSRRSALQVPFLVFNPNNFMNKDKAVASRNSFG